MVIMVLLKTKVYLQTIRTKQQQIKKQKSL